MPTDGDNDSKVRQIWRRKVICPARSFLGKLFNTLGGFIIASLFYMSLMWAVAYAMALLFFVVRDENRILVVMAAGLGEVTFANIITLLWKHFRFYLSQARRRLLLRIRKDDIDG